MHDYLKKILYYKSKEVENLKKNFHPISSKKRSTLRKKSLRQALEKCGVIAEIKRRSPSKSTLASIKDPMVLSRRYLSGGAAAISVLTDSYGFGGSIEDLKCISNQLINEYTPVLRKDFIVDPIQISDSVNHGADVVLLIVSILKEKTESFLNYVNDLNIEAIVEVHDKEECDYAVSIGADIIGINNRNLKTFEADPERSFALREHLPSSVLCIAESGISSPEMVKSYFDSGFKGVLIGEALVKSHNPEGFIKECLNDVNKN